MASKKVCRGFISMISSNNDPINSTKVLLKIISKLKVNVENELRKNSSIATDKNDSKKSASNYQEIQKSILTNIDILQKNPENPNALFLLGLALHSKNENIKAAALLSRAVSLKLENEEVYSTLGSIYKSLGNLEEANNYEKKAIAFNPDYIDGYYNIGCNLLSLGKNNDAIKKFRKTISLNPNHYMAHNNLGVAMHNIKLFQEAMESFNNSLSIKPDYPAPYLSMGNTLREMNQTDAAATSFQKAIALDFEFFEAHNNLANALMDLGLYEGALVSYNNAKKIKPENTGVRKNIGMINLLLGNFEIGWSEYSSRQFEDDLGIASQDYSQPKWNGENLNSKTIFVCTEQGLGDTIQFIRYLDLLKAQCKQIILNAPSPLVPVLEDLNSIDVLLTNDAITPDFDYHISLMELPRLFSTTLDTIPMPSAYLAAKKNLVKIWEKRLGPRKEFRIGLVWAGSATHQNDHNRSIDPDLLKPLTELSGISVYSLLVGRKGEATAVFGKNIYDFTGCLTNFAETAAAIENMDLVISVDTSVAHLAGALGKPVWVLLPFNPDWRWLLKRTDSPWYSSMKLFRQTKRQDWKGVIEQVIGELTIKTLS